MATMTEMLNDGRTTRTVLAQMLASRYVTKVERGLGRFAPPGTFERVRGLAYEIIDALGDGWPMAELIAENADNEELGDLLRFARDGGIEAAHERATQAA